MRDLLRRRDLTGRSFAGQTFQADCNVAPNASVRKRANTLAHGRSPADSLAGSPKGRLSPHYSHARKPDVRQGSKNRVSPLLNARVGGKRPDRTLGFFVFFASLGQVAGLPEISDRRSSWRQSLPPSALQRGARYEPGVTQRASNLHPGGPGGVRARSQIGNGPPPEPAPANTRTIARDQSGAPLRCLTGSMRARVCLTLSRRRTFDTAGKPRGPTLRDPPSSNFFTSVVPRMRLERLTYLPAAFAFRSNSCSSASKSSRPRSESSRVSVFSQSTVWKPLAIACRRSAIAFSG